MDPRIPHDDSPPTYRRELPWLCPSLSPSNPHAITLQALGGGNAKHMGSKNLIRASKVAVERARFTVARVEQNVGCRDKEDMVVDRLALRGYVAFEESAEVGVEGWHSWTSRR